MELRLKWNKIIVEPKIILFHFRRHVWNEIKIILAASTIISKNFRPTMLK